MRQEIWTENFDTTLHQKVSKKNKLQRFSRKPSYVNAIFRKQAPGGARTSKQRVIIFEGNFLNDPTWTKLWRNQF